MSVAVLTRTLARSELTLMTRYPLEFISGLGAIYALFLGVFFGAKYLTLHSPTANQTVDAFVIGYLTVVACTIAFQNFGQELLNEAQSGTLEQLAMSPFGLVPVLAVRGFTALLWQISMTVIAAALMFATSREPFHYTPATILVATGLTAANVLSAMGLGLASAGLVIVFKRIQTIQNLMQFTFIGLVALPIAQYPVLKVLPAVLGNNLMLTVLQKGQMPSLANLAVLLAVTVFWVSVGLIVFRRCEVVARSRGILGHY